MWICVASFVKQDLLSYPTIINERNDTITIDWVKLPPFPQWRPQSSFWRWEWSASDRCTGGGRGSMRRTCQTGTFIRTIQWVLDETPFIIHRIYVISTPHTPPSREKVYATHQKASDNFIKDKGLFMRWAFPWIIHMKSDMQGFQSPLFTGHYRSVPAVGEEDRMDSILRKSKPSSCICAVSWSETLWSTLLFSCWKNATSSITQAKKIYRISHFWLNQYQNKTDRIKWIVIRQ